MVVRYVLRQLSDCFGRLRRGIAEGDKCLVGRIGDRGQTGRPLCHFTVQLNYDTASCFGANARNAFEQIRIA